MALAMLRPFSVAFALALLLLASPSARAQAPYVGRWAGDLNWCRNIRASGTDEMPIAIWPRTIETFASTCLVQSAVRATHAMWRLRTICRDEGQSEDEPRTVVTFLLRVDGNRLYLRDNTGVRNLTRCPD
jgi:hypothetical protein